MIGSLGFDMSLVQRSRGGDALWHSAYVCGGAARLADGSVVDFSKRNDVIASFIVKPEGTPAWAADCAQLWRRAVAAEKRADAQEARLFELTIPRALPRKHWVKLGRHVARTLADHGMVVQVGIHCPLASDDDINPHIHFVATMREIVDGEFSRKKARHWNKIFHGNAKAVRRQIAAIVNEFCRNAGVDYQVDPRSNAERGLPPAEIRLPHWHILHYKRTGQKTRAMEQRDEERAARADVARLEAECRQLERELEAARADASAQEIASTARPPVARALPHLRLARPHLGAAFYREPLTLLEFPVDRPKIQVVPDLTDLHKDLRGRLAHNSERLRACALLRAFVAADNPDQMRNVDRALRYCHGAVTKALVRRFAVAPPRRQAADELDALDLMEALTELDPAAWSDVELSRFEGDLDTLTMPRGLLWQPAASKRLPVLDRGAHEDPTL
ncbi:MobA/MobL family protein [Bradyrhizobium centrosematis]|uniref:MobA/MobL family protein n=1 Tax=Bradyrhizobium centrosematis TaxID=1300039 RepID=UPI00216A6F8C|nr:MobA/MobL family protein [Bradyrhizobium centrosematis]MCS3765279.1 hypothetical protein [Bradyrhizobium centrosematis]MCS3774022.1 hypothetical protein [Bradyrhizobium centrosematis]